MSNLSRRTLVASAAALPAIALPAVAISATEPDPIFAAIEAHKNIHDRFVVALYAADVPDKRSRDERTARVHIGDHNEGDYSMDEKDPDGGYTIRYKLTGEKTPIYARTVEEIKRNVPRDLDGSARETWIAERIAQLEKEQQRIDDEYAQTEHGQLEAAERQASKHERNALWEMVSTVPTTLAGIAALLAHLRTHEGFSAILDDQYDEIFAWTMERAVCALAGLPEPPMSRAVAKMEDVTDDDEPGEQRS
jgi:hypothetical protein